MVDNLKYISYYLLQILPKNELIFSLISVQQPRPVFAIKSIGLERIQFKYKELLATNLLGHVVQSLR